MRGYEVTVVASKVAEEGTPRVAARHFCGDGRGRHFAEG
jgi:hypothetical protein